MSAEEELARLKARQAAYYRKWRKGDKGRAYYEKNKDKIKAQRAARENKAETV